MAVKVWTDSEIDFYEFVPDAAHFPGATWPASMNGDSGTSTAVSSSTGAYIAALGSLHDDGTVPTTIVMSDILVEFDYASSTTGSASPAAMVTDSAVGGDLPLGGAGSTSGHYAHHSDPAGYFGGTDRAAMFLVPGVTWAYSVYAGITAAHLVITNYTITITYTGSDPPPPVPTISGISPTSGDVAGGDTITITGTHFVSGMIVNLDHVAATSVVVVSAT